MPDFEPKILIVDDDKQVCSVLVKILSGTNYQIEIAHNAQSALTLCSKHIFDLALVDLHLPDMNGQNLISRIHEKHPTIEFIIITGHATQEIMSYAVRNKYIVDCLQKPLSTNHVKGLVQEVIKRQTLACELKAAECAILSAKLLSEEYINSLPGLFYVFSKTKFIKWNDEFRLVSGYTNDEIKNMYGPDFFEGEDKDKIKDAMKDVFTKGHSVVEATFISKDGIKTPYYFTGHRKIIEGELYLIGMGIDLTQNKKTQDELKQSELKYRDLYHNAPDMFVSVSAEDGLIRECNKTFLKNMGYTKKEVLGKHIFEMYHENVMDDVKRTFNDFKNGEEISNRELQLKRKDGSKIDVALNVSVIRDHEGNVCCSRSSWRDITDKKEAEKALKESEKRYKAMYDHMTSGVAVYTSYDNGESFIFLDMNAAGEKITQTPKEDLIGKNLLEVFPGCETEDFDLLDSFRKVWKTGEPVFHPSCLYKDDRIKDFWPENSIYKLNGDELVAIFTDVTERRQIQEALDRERYFLKKAQEIGKIGTWEIDLERNILLWTEENHRVFGVPEDEDLTYETFLSKVHPDDRDFVNNEWQKSISTEGVPYELEHRVLMDDGRIKWVKEKAELYFENGKCVRAVGFSQDITDMKEAESQKNVSLQLKTALLDNMEEVVLFFRGPDLHIEWANQAAAKLINKPIEELKGRTCYELFTHGDKPCEGCPVLETFKTGEPADILKENDGSQIFHSKTVKVEANGMSGVMEISTDVTTEMRLQQFFKEKIDEWVVIERENHIDLKKEKLKLNESLLQLRSQRRAEGFN